jgi:L-threonylcarbamoyladenylate synthase
MKEVEILKNGGVGIIPTDTIYGLLASAFNEQAINRAYDLKGRSRDKKSIILISSLDDLAKFSITPTEKQKEIISSLWPGQVSIIFPNGISFRLPNDANLISFLKESGPCIAPSANPEGFPPAETIEEAQKYFGDKVDFYIDGGKRSGMPSTLISLDEEGIITVLRQGAKQISV